MKRAAILIIAIATLVLIGYPSAPSLADSSVSINTSKSSTSAGTVVVTGGSTLSGCGEGGGGTDQGDADGLSGFKGRPPVTTLQNEVAGAARVMVALENWWKFMLWIR
jgi:hypothetical protein